MLMLGEGAFCCCFIFLFVFLLFGFQEVTLNLTLHLSNTCLNTNYINTLLKNIGKWALVKHEIDKLATVDTNAATYPYILFLMHYQSTNLRLKMANSIPQLKYSNRMSYVKQVMIEKNILKHINYESASTKQKGKIQSMC